MFSSIITVALLGISVWLVVTLWFAKPETSQKISEETNATSETKVAWCVYVPLFFFIVFSFFLAWYSCLNEKGIYISRFHFPLGIPSVFWSILCLLIPLIYLLRKQINPLFARFFQQNSAQKVSWLIEYFRDHRNRQIVPIILWVVMLSIMFFGMGSFILYDWHTVAQKFMSSVEQKETNAPVLQSASHETMSPGWNLNASGEFLARIVFPITGGIIAVFALIFNYRRTNAMVHQTMNQQKQLENTDQTLKNSHQQLENSLQGQDFERYKSAIDHLGSTNPIVIIGGIHTLYELALQKPTYRESVCEIFCKYPTTEIAKGITKASRKIINQAIVDKLFPISKEKNIRVIDQMDTNKDKYCLLDFHDAQLEGMNFNKRLIQDANFFNAKLSGVSFCYTILQNVDLELADLSKADMRDANLEGANLKNAKLKEAILQGVEMNGANLENTRLDGANMENAAMNQVSLVRTKMEKVRLVNAKMQDADLTDTEIIECDLQNLDLRFACLSGTVFRSNGSGAEFYEVNLQGVQSSIPYHANEADVAYDQIMNEDAFDEGIKTDLSGVILIDEYGNELDLNESEKKEWFRKRGAKVDDLSYDEVRQLAIERGYVG